MESDLVAGQHPSTDRQRRARRLYLRRLCRYSVSVRAGMPEERDHYDWMGYVGNFIGVFGLLPLPFAGYWLMREIYQYNQQMGITLMGGFLSWLFILAGHVDRGAVPRLELLFLAGDHASDSRVRSCSIASRSWRC